MILNRQSTALVVDSTADLPDSLSADPNVTVVPLTVHIGNESYLDWLELTPPEFYRKLAACDELPRTSQPAAGVFSQIYRGLRERYSNVYSIHLSSEFSGTFASACMAQESIDGVTVIDSRLATGGIALLVDRLVDRLAGGIEKADFDAYISRYISDRGFFFIPETLDYLAKGGRIGRAAHLMGTLLSVKPVLQIKDGMADAYKRVRGMRQALEAVKDALVQHTQPGRPVYLALMHALNLPLLERLREGVRSIPDRDIEIRLTSIVGPVIGTYSGPGAVGICFIQE